MKPYTLVSASGQLGAGFQAESIDKAIARGAQMIGCDSGGNDGGPIGLATGRTRFSREALKRDLDVILTRAIAAKLPVFIGSAATAGADPNLAWMVALVREIAKERGLHFPMGIVHAEIEKDTVRGFLRNGRLRPLKPSKQLTEKDIDDSIHIVGMMGAEPFQEAYKQGAQVVIAGRASDTSIFAALPLLEGIPPAIAWHAAKILECGAAAVMTRTSSDSIMTVLHEDYFDVMPLRDDYRCSPQSVAAHTLYENANPFELIEPSGILNTQHCTYEAISDRDVRVRGSHFTPSTEYTIKIEGARARGYATIVMAGMRDRVILGQLDDWLKRLEETTKQKIESTMPGVKYDLITRVYGRDGVLGKLEPTPVVGHEVMIFWQVLAEKQELAHSIAQALSHLALHFSIPQWKGSITAIAFPVTPGEIDRGPVFEFHMNHIVVPDSPTSLFPIEIEKV